MSGKIMLRCARLASPYWIYLIILLRFQGEMILDMTYGYEVKGRHDKKLDISIRVNDFVIVTLPPGALLVNELPFCMSSPTFA